MKFQPKNVNKTNTKRIGRFQEGGPMPTEDPTMVAEPRMEEGAPAPEQGGGDPLMQIAQVFMQGLQNQDCNMLAQGAQMFLQLLQQAQDGGAPAEEQGAPVFKRGGQLIYRLPKNKK